MPFRYVIDYFLTSGRNHAARSHRFPSPPAVYTSDLVPTGVCTLGFPSPPTVCAGSLSRTGACTAVAAACSSSSRDMARRGYPASGAGDEFRAFWRRILPVLAHVARFSDGRCHGGRIFTPSDLRRNRVRYPPRGNLALKNRAICANLGKFRPEIVRNHRGPATWAGLCLFWNSDTRAHYVLVTSRVQSAPLYAI